MKTEPLCVSVRPLPDVWGSLFRTGPEEWLAGQSDPNIWKAAQREQRFLITQDLDFSDAGHFVPGAHSASRKSILLTSEKYNLARIFAI
jgi:hypothetical protein